MLVATGLLAGAVSSWADTTELSPTQTTQIKSANADNIMYNASATSWTCSQSKISNGAFTAPDSKGNYPGPIILTKFDASSTLSGQKLTKATLSFKSKCTVSKKNSNVQVAQINTGWDATTATWTNTNTATVLNAVNIDETTNGVNVSTSSKTITLDVTSYLNASTDNTIGFAIYTYTAREQSVSEIKLSLEYLDASSVSSYTVKYVDANGNELKTSTTATGTAGQKAELTETEKAAIYSTDGKKYVYSSDDSDSYTIATDGSTVITVKFREAETWNYTVKCIDSNSTTFKEIKGSALEGETVTPAYPYALNVDGTLYTTDKTQSSDQKGFQMSFALSKDNLEKSITYKATKTTGIVYFSEAEDIEGVTVCNNGNTAIRSSNGSSAYVAAEDGIALTKLTAGTYKINTVLCDATKNLNGEFKFAVGSQELSVTSTVVNWDEKSTPSNPQLPRIRRFFQQKKESIEARGVKNRLWNLL